MYNNKAQAAMIDMALTLLILAAFAAGIIGLENDSASSALSLRHESINTKSTLIGLLECSAQSPVFEKYKISDVLALYFLNQTTEEEIAAEINSQMESYLPGKNIEWTLYTEDKRPLWIPQGKVLQGKHISSASTILYIQNNQTVNIYLFIKWRQ